MKTNRELLELAAKAAGYQYIKPIEDYDGNLGLEVGSTNPMRTYTWNPLKDDGDAFRLAIRLKMEVDFDDVRVAVRTRQGIKVLEDEGGDLYAATRRAIVRAAAEIGAAAQKGTP